MTVTAVVGVRERRREHRTTQAELAAAVGVSRQTIISIERGEHAPSVYLALRIGRALDARVEDLFPLPEGEN
ncbi:helix-turn-helix transcriptional regulator [Agilicoccus flavus]|uniref:helix-turn-helix transcriptional regulator n=1 Tax=Agilicoccus flavus TaxID=2775968 RepID=UPI001CF6B892|nr:helix-turn-helix transcriptional regulator [Agilicoccus flavus]